MFLNVVPNNGVNNTFCATIVSQQDHGSRLAKYMYQCILRVSILAKAVISHRISMFVDHLLVVRSGTRCVYCAV